MKMFDSKIKAESDERASTAAPPPGGRRWLWPLVLVVALAGGGVAAWQWRAAHPPGPPPAVARPVPSLTVSVAAAISRAVTATVIGDGSVVAWQELVIGAEVGGLRIVEAPIEEGNSVSAGQVLARLDDSLILAQIAQVDAAINEAVAAVEIARADQLRSEDLVRSQSASRQLVEQRQSATRQAEARLISTRARREEAVARLAQTRILAPTDGVISRVSVRIGAVTALGQEMFRIIRDGRLELDARVPEMELADVQPGQPAVVRHGGRSIPAEVRILAPVISAETRLGIVHVALPPDSGLRPGMFARAEITGPTRQVVMVPASAVVFRDGAPQAFVLPPGGATGETRVAMRRLTAGARLDGMVEVTAGLTAGERVVTAGAGFLVDGDLVQIAP